MKYEARMMMGRLASGLQGGHGVRVHAVEAGTTAAYCHGKAICGARPGRRSCGWSDVEKLPISCPKCQAKLIRALEAEGMTTSDAQGVLMAKESA
jgi:hypothetical protein